MNKKEFLAAVAAKSGLKTSDSNKALNAALETITDAMAAGDSIQFKGFGTFSASQLAERNARIIRTGEIVKIPAHRVPTFKSSPVLKAKVR